MLSAARPEGKEGGLGKDVTIRKAVDLAETKIAGVFTDQPTIEASVRSVLAETYYYLGEPALAIRQQERALELRTALLGDDHCDTLNTRNSLALSYWAAGQNDRAIPMLERTLAARLATSVRDHPDTLDSQNNLAMAYQGASALTERYRCWNGRWRRARSSSGPITPIRSSVRLTSRTPIGLPATGSAPSPSANGR